ncbi:MAG: hypothetical protein UFG06_09505 [Lachnospiraceae bacterium]|nr:hypothetical protein [Lachnospiraceae bacterium]
MGKKKREKFVDDGRTVADMNVEGMPWYAPAAQKGSGTGVENAPLTLSRKEKAAMMKGVMTAALLVAFVFVAVFTLFILFCVFVWFA